MDEKQVSKAVFKKLSALRATLTDEEQVLLDQLVVGEHDVSAHRLSTAATAARVTTLAKDAEEVEAHRLSAAATAARVTTLAKDAEEVEAHRLSTAATAARVTTLAKDAEEVEAHRLNLEDSRLSLIRVTFDQGKDIYLVE